MNTSKKNLRLKNDLNRGADPPYSPLVNVRETRSRAYQQHQRINNTRTPDLTIAQVHSSPYGVQQMSQTNIQHGFAGMMERLALVEDKITAIPTRVVQVLEGEGRFYFREPTARDSGVFNDEAARQSGTSQDEIALIQAFQDRIGELENQCRNMQVEAQVFHEEKQTLGVQLMAANTKIRELQRIQKTTEQDLQQSKQKEYQLRSIVLQNTGAQQVTDQDVITSFSTLRQRINGLARNKAFDLAKKPDLSQDADQSMKDFYSLWDMERNITIRDIKRRVQSEMFSAFDAWYLSRKCYGLYKAVDDRFCNIEDWLMRFEDILEEHKVSNSSICDWRICTLRCVDLLGLKNEYAEAITKEIFNYFTPLVSSQATRDVQDNLIQQIGEISRHAFDLVMMMRKSKEGYSCESMISGKMNQNEHIADVFAVEGGGNEDDNYEIAYVLFGALTKESQALQGQRVVLEKALVVLKGREDVEIL